MYMKLVWTRFLIAGFICLAKCILFEEVLLTAICNNYIVK